MDKTVKKQVSRVRFEVSKFDAAAIPRESDGTIVAEHKVFLRRRCQTDLRFLHSIVTADLNPNLVCERVHGPVFDFYPPPQLDKSIDQQSVVKAYLLLDPRGTFKTSIKNIRRAQTMLAFPDARHGIISSRNDFANARVRGIGSLFVRRAKANLFQELFAEFCVDRPGDAFKSENQKLWFTLPNKDPEAHPGEVDQPTLMAGSGESSQSGWHFEFLDEDDIVDNRNTQTAGGIENVNKNIAINRKMLMPWGYREGSGTRYHPFDRYGVDMDSALPGELKLLKRAAIWWKDGRRFTLGNFPQPEECELLWPEVLTYGNLRQAFFESFDAFMSQMINDAYGAHEVIFPRELLLGALVPAQAVPFVGEEVRVVWRPGYSGKNWSCAAGAAGMVAGGRLYVTEVQRGNFAPSQMGQKIVEMCRRQGTHRVTMERAPGAGFLESTIQNQGLLEAWPMMINWLEYEEDDGVRQQRVKQTEPMLAGRRLLLSEGIEAAMQRELLRQFTAFGMVEENEIPDVVARLGEGLPKSIAANEQKDDDLAWQMMVERDRHDRVYNLGRYAPQEEPVVAEAEPGGAAGLVDELGGLRG